MDPKLINMLRFELERWLHAADADAERHRDKVARCAAELVAQTASEDQLALRRLVLELRDALAEQRLPASLVQLQRELERASVATAAMRKAAAAPAPPNPIGLARALLRGRVLVVIGGIPRPEHMANLRSTFELAEVVWPETSETKPTLTVLEPHVARPDVAAVVLLIRWIRHNLNDVALLCARHGKPLVRAPGGYNVNQIAQLVVEQSRRRGD